MTLLKYSGIAAVLLLLAGLTGCGSSGPAHHLGDYDFSTGSVAVVFYNPPAPELRTGGVGLVSGNPVKALLRAGSRVARESHARDAAAKLDSAVQRVDFAPQLAERMLERSSRYLAATPAREESAADFVLEVDLEGVGLSAESEELGLFVIGETVLLHSATGREIWNANVRSVDPITENMVGDALAQNVLGSYSLSQMTVEDFEALLPELADYAADEIVLRLRADLRDVRE